MICDQVIKGGAVFKPLSLQNHLKNANEFVMRLVDRLNEFEGIDTRYVYPPDAIRQPDGLTRYRVTWSIFVLPKFVDQVPLIKAAIQSLKEELT